LINMLSAAPFGLARLRAPVEVDEDENPCTPAGNNTPCAAAFAAFVAMTRTPVSPAFDPLGAMDLSQPLSMSSVVDSIETVLMYAGRATTAAATNALLAILR
jgi:hypothetical protein